MDSGSSALAKSSGDRTTFERCIEFVLTQARGESIQSYSQKSGKTS